MDGAGQTAVRGDGQTLTLGMKASVTFDEAKVEIRNMQMSTPTPGAASAWRPEGA